MDISDVLQQRSIIIVSRKSQKLHARTETIAPSSIYQADAFTTCNSAVLVSQSTAHAHPDPPWFRQPYSTVPVLYLTDTAAAFFLIFTDTAAALDFRISNLFGNSKAEFYGLQS